jgi:Fe-S-cluster-containing dehydrogenase component
MKHEQKHNPPMKYGMAIDLDKCTGCGACMVACMSENNIRSRKMSQTNWSASPGCAFSSSPTAKSFRIRISATSRGPASTAKATAAQPLCVGLPGNGHRLQPETGIVSQIYTRCFGCRYCMGACPYHARYFNWWDPVWPDGMEKYLSPNVSPRMRGVVEKCSFCFHRYQLAKNKAY